MYFFLIPKAAQRLPIRRTAGIQPHKDIPAQRGSHLPRPPKRLWIPRSSRGMTCVITIGDSSQRGCLDRSLELRKPLTGTCWFRRWIVHRLRFMSLLNVRQIKARGRGNDKIDKLERELTARLLDGGYDPDEVLRDISMKCSAIYPSSIG